MLFSSLHFDKLENIHLNRLGLCFVVRVNGFLRVSVMETTGANQKEKSKMTLLEAKLFSMK